MLDELSDLTSVANGDEALVRVGRISVLYDLYANGDYK